MLAATQGGSSAGEVTQLLVELGALVLGLALAGRLAGRIGLSPVPLYLLGGLAFGNGGIVPLTSVEGFTEVSAEIGVLLLLLLLGVEYSARELVGNLATGAPAGLVDLVLNATPGLVCGLLLGFGTPGSVALAGVTYISSTGIIAKLLRDLDRIGNRETPAVLSVLVLEDLAMAVYLPVLTVLLAGRSVAAGVSTVALALLVLGVVLLVTLRYTGVVNAVVQSEDREVLLLGIVGLTLLVAGLAQAAQVSSAVGAFLVGIALSGPVADRAIELLSPLRDLFAAVFFVVVGLQTDPRVIPSVLLPAVLLAVACTATKGATGWYAAQRAGVGVAGRIRAGAVLVPRGEFSIVIGGLAVTAGLSGRLGALITTFVLIMAVLGPITARLADPLSERALDRAEARATRRAAA